jgi:hypothetical protein
MSPVLRTRVEAWLNAHANNRGPTPLAAKSARTGPG